MIKTGRILTLITLWGVLSFIGLAVMDNPDITIYALTIYSVNGVVTIGAAVLSWILAILHWALRYTAEHRAEWGIAITLGTPFGAGLYWFLALPRERPRQTP